LPFFTYIYYLSTFISHLIIYICRLDIQVLQVRELIEVKEVITPYGRSGSEETIVILRKT